MVEITPVVAAVAGGLVGAIGTFIAGEIREYRKRARERENLRIALFQEIVSNDLVEYLLGGYRPADSGFTVTSQVYDGNAAKIGILSDEEIKQITRYYSKSNNLQYLLSIGLENDESWSDKLRHKVDMALAGQVISSQLTALATLAEKSDKICLAEIEETENIINFLEFTINHHLDGGEEHTLIAAFENEEINVQEPVSDLLETFRNYSLKEESLRDKIQDYLPI